ncbi:hypothetical protein BsWGS_26323 [Bradybaena similaris]
MSAAPETETQADGSSTDRQTDGANRDAQTEGTSKEKESKKKRGRPLKLPQCCVPSNMQPAFYVGGSNGVGLVEGPLLAIGWRRTLDKGDNKCKLKWTESKGSINYNTFREGEQLVNHIPNSKLLTNKLGLLCSLQEYERVFLLTKGRLPRMKMCEFVPETFKLDERTDRERFLAEYKDGETWICKPVGLNQGKGIFLLRSREEIDQVLNERDAKATNLATSTKVPMMRIVQRYLGDPLLLEGRKFDIRAYLFIACTVPFLVLFHQGYVRLSCQKYHKADTNLTTHLTNQYIQKKDPSYQETKEDTVWTMDKLNLYINEKVAAGKGLEADWVYKTLTKQMQKIALHCFHCVRHKLHCKMGYFDLYGMDFMVDNHMKVWLIEVNTNPSLQTNCQALKEAIPCVVESALYLAIECFEKSRKGQPLMPLNSLGGFTALYCGSGCRAAAPRQSRSVSPVKETTEWSKPAGNMASSRRYSPIRLQPRMSLSPTFNSYNGPVAWAASSAMERKATVLSCAPTSSIEITSKPVISRENTITAKLKRQQQQQQQQQQQSVETQQVQQPQQLPSVAVTAVAAGAENKIHTRQIEFRLPKSRNNPHRGS